MADPRRLREILGFGYGAPSPAMSALQPFHAGVDPAYMPQDVVTESPGEGPSSYVRSGLESLLGLFAPSDRAAAETAGKLNAVADFNPLQGAYDIGKGIGDAWQGGDKLGVAMSMIPGKADEALVPAVKAAQKSIKAYHGTPHDFEKFDLSKIGTGEGAQAYGHGLYFAENEGVAKEYRDRLSRLVGDTQTPLGALDRALGMADGNREAARKSLENEVKAFSRYNSPRVAEYEEAIRMLDAGVKPGGSMYEVNINADPDAFLDWDKPLSQQQKVRQVLGLPDLHPDMTPEQRNAALNALGVDQSSNFGGDLSRVTGADLIESPALKEAGLTERMKQAGIPGIKYLDAGSRDPVKMKELADDLAQYREAAKHWASTGDDAKLAIANKQIEVLENRINSIRNYVVFSDEIIDIVKKYGLAAAIASGVITQQMADQLQAQQGGGQS